MKTFVRFAVCIATISFHGECEAQTANNGWITFLSHRSGGNLLYKMRPDGTALTPIFGGELKGVPSIPAGMVYYREPHFAYQSPDGRSFLDWALDACSKDDNLGRPLGRPIVQLHLGTLGGGPTRVVAAQTVTEDFAWSPDSKRFIYSEIYETRSLSGKMIYTPKQFKMFDESAPNNTQDQIILEKSLLWEICDWSPDGKNLLFLVASDIDIAEATCQLVQFNFANASEMRKRMPFILTEDNIKELDSNLRTVMTEKKGVRILGGRYSPNGKQIVTAIMTGLNNIKLVLIDVDSGNVRDIISYPDGLRGPYCWSPDGSEILFSRHLAEYDVPEKMSGGLGTWAIRPDGSHARFITTGWSADWK